MRVEGRAAYCLLVRITHLPVVEALGARDVTGGLLAWLPSLAGTVPVFGAGEELQAVKRPIATTREGSSGQKRVMSDLR